LSFGATAAAYDLRGRQMKSLPAGPSATVKKPLQAKAAR
jgi:hypothetical protein